MNSLLWTLLGDFHSQGARFSRVLPAAQALLRAVPQLRYLDLGSDFRYLPEVRPCFGSDLHSLRPFDQLRLRVLPLLRETRGGGGDLGGCRKNQQPSLLDGMSGGLHSGGSPRIYAEGGSSPRIRGDELTSARRAPQSWQDVSPGKGLNEPKSFRDGTSDHH